MTSLFNMSTFYNRFIFTRIYSNDLFNKKAKQSDGLSISGPGSGIYQTQEIIKKLPLILKKYMIKSVLDIPCGDFYWMEKVNLNDVNYIGSDIVKSLIVNNQRKYSRDNINFKVLDIMNDDLPTVDLILCRDLFVHMTNKQINKGIQNILKSNSKYLLTTSFVSLNQNSDINSVGNWRPINLEIEPFNLLNPIEYIDEKCTEVNNKYSDKQLLLYKIN